MAVSDTNERFVEAVAKLLQLTQQRAIRWDPATAADVGLVAIPDPDAPFRNVFLTKHLDRKLRLYEKLTEERTIADILGAKKPLRTWKVYLELSDVTGKGWWPFPRTESTADLMRAVQYQVSGVDEFVDSLMKS